MGRRGRPKEIPAALKPKNVQLEKDHLLKLRETCEHQYWATERNEHTCENCFQWLDFVKRCTVCGWQLCYRCLEAKQRTEWPLSEEPQGCKTSRSRT